VSRRTVEVVRINGVNYDTGMAIEDDNTRPDFDPDVARRELRIIADDLHATAVRVSGADVDRIATASRLALDAGLDAWFAPFPVDLEPDELVSYLEGAAAAAEQVRRAAVLAAPAGREVVLVLGCEMTLFGKGFVPGDGLRGRIATMMDPATWATEEGRAPVIAGFAKAYGTHRRIAEAARKIFKGRITYAAGMWEQVEWDLYDIVSVDAYRDAQNAADFPGLLRQYRAFGKPVVASEFGCCTYRGAADRGGLGWDIVDDKRSELTGDYERDEAEQVRYLHELSAEFDAAGFEGAFWFSFAGYTLPHRGEPKRDLDMGSYGLVAVYDDGRHGTTYPDMTWEPKLSFHALAALYGGSSGMTISPPSSSPA
jgi:hypothetical protein